ncbi:MAG: ATP-binding protein, partial [Mycobacterium sp.]
MFDRPIRALRPAATTGPADTPDRHDSAPAAAKRPPTWSLRNWPVRWKVVAIVVVPLVLAMVFGGFRIYGAMTDVGDLRLAADRAELIPAITKYMSALDSALLASSQGGDVEGVKKNYQARRDELQVRLSDTDVVSDVRAGVDTLVRDGQALLNKVVSNAIGLRERVTTYAPI